MKNWSSPPCNRITEGLRIKMVDQAHNHSEDQADHEIDDDGVKDYPDSDKF